MKILYINNSRIPTEKAHGTQIMKMCESFANAGVDIELILPTRNNKEFKGVSFFEYYQIKQNFTIKKIFSLDPYWLIKLPQGIYIKFQALFFIISLFFYLLFKKNKHDYIFYTRDEYLLPILQLFSKKVIWEAHTLPSNKDRYLKYWLKCFKIITISQGLKKNLVDIGINHENILVAHDAVDLEKFSIQDAKVKTRERLNLPLDKKIIIYTGHLYEWKGAQVLADAAKYLSADQLIIFVGGTINDVKDFTAKNIKFINNGRIILLGYKSPDQMPLYLKAADVLALPNTKKDPKASWTSPMKLFEYMASGTPIVAADLAVVKEVLSENSVIFFKADQSKDLAYKINLVLQNKKLADKISQQALLDVQQYTWQKRVEKIINFLK